WRFDRGGPSPYAEAPPCPPGPQGRPGRTGYPSAHRPRPRGLPAPHARGSIAGWPRPDPELTCAERVQLSRSGMEVEKDEEETGEPTDVAVEEDLEDDSTVPEGLGALG